MKANNGDMLPQNTPNTQPPQQTPNPFVAIPENPQDKGFWSKLKSTIALRDKWKAFMSWAKSGKDLSSIFGASCWQVLKNFKVFGKIATGQWNMESAKELAVLLLDTGVKIPVCLVWFGILPPWPGKFWSYVFMALSLKAQNGPKGSKLQNFLNRYVYPSTFQQKADEFNANKQQQQPQPVPVPNKEAGTLYHSNLRKTAIYQLNWYDKLVIAHAAREIDSLIIA